MILLPIEVIATNVPAFSITLPAPASSLWMQVHGLNLANKASVQINDSNWVDLNNTTVSVEQPGKAFGGIGGGFESIKFTLTLPPGTAIAGENTIRFRLNDITRESIVYRVLAFNFLAGTNRLLSETNFIQDNPAAWTPPLPDVDSIQAGNTIWHTAPLLNRGHPMKVHCTDCHTHNGRDLKYFNYSSTLIAEECKFHGLTQLQGDQVASYIRSLPFPVMTNARPWNPPYQPGPGMDSKPVNEWAVGAGLDWVLPKDSDTFNYINPSNMDFSATLNAREVPVAIQYPDWNHWLPEFNPIDAWGTNFTGSMLFKRYAIIRNAMGPDRVANAKMLARNSNDWFRDAVVFFGRDGTPAVPIPPVPWPLDFQIKLNGTMHWRMVKFWEIITEFDLQDMGHEVLGESANDRTWYDEMPFNMAPHFMKLDQKNNPLNDGSLVNWNYFSMAWYRVQLTLNNSNRRGNGTGPIDWPYTLAFDGTVATPDVGTAGLLMVDLISAAQNVNNGQSPRAWGTGWDPCYRANVFMLSPEPNLPYMWKQIPTDKRRELSEIYLKNWIDKTTSYSPDDYYFSNFPTFTGIFSYPQEIVGNNTMGGRWIDRYWATIPNCRKLGVNETLLTRMIDFGQKLWPSNNWNSLRVAVAPHPPTSLIVKQ